MQCGSVALRWAALRWVENYTNLTGVPSSVFEETVVFEEGSSRVPPHVRDKPKNVSLGGYGLDSFSFGFTVLRYVAFRFCCVSFWVPCCIALVLSFVLSGAHDISSPLEISGVQKESPPPGSLHSVSFRFGFVW